MLKICRDKWDKNSKRLEEILKDDIKLNCCDYKYIVEMTYKTYSMMTKIHIAAIH